jgi:hypothetical protein
MPKPPPELYQCDGIAHEWAPTPAEEGEQQAAVALCCGIRAVKKRGEWMLEDDLPGKG